MRVKIRSKLSDTDADTGKHYSQAKGDVIEVPTTYGQKLCDRGWADDLSGEYVSADLKPGGAKLHIHNGFIGVRDRK